MAYLCVIFYNCLGLDKKIDFLIYIKKIKKQFNKKHYFYNY